MKQIFLIDGRVEVGDVPPPECGPYQVLVSTKASVISAGTETAALDSGAGGGSTNVLAKALRNPELVGRAIKMVQEKGLATTISAIRGTQSASGFPLPLGYSAAGEILEVGKEVEELAVGDRVACAGAGYACHADTIAVPANLVSRIPEGVPYSSAAFTTLGAIALQGVRRAEAQLGERVVVVGLGLIGLIAVQVLQAAGCCVLGVDLDAERVQLAEELGVNVGVDASAEDAIKAVDKFTGGRGADAVLIYAATPSSQPVRDAMKMARRKGRVVIVGDVGLDLVREHFYRKELDLRISTSYGPGRYDPRYEERGVDYPFGYVRWTENRNMQAFLELVSSEEVSLEPLKSSTYAVSDAPVGYADLQNEDGAHRPLGIVLNYPASDDQWSLGRLGYTPEISAASGGAVGLAIIGPGAFAQDVHMPNLQEIGSLKLQAVVGRTPHKVQRIAKRFDVPIYSAQSAAIYDDERVEAVLIGTRHDSHAHLAIEAAENGCHAFVEKPLALSPEAAEEVCRAFERSGKVLTVGFNRRFSPLAQEFKRQLDTREGPAVIHMRVNSASMTPNHWINDPVEGGGAIRGEAVHFFDLLAWLVGGPPIRLSSENVARRAGQREGDQNNLSSAIRFADGSVATLLYTTLGDKASGKERLEAYADKRSFLLDDFQSLKVTPGETTGSVDRSIRKIDKGHRQLLDAFGEAVSQGIFHEDLPDGRAGLQATVLAEAAIESCRTAKSVKFKH